MKLPAFCFAFVAAFCCVQSATAHDSQRSNVSLLMLASDNSCSANVQLSDWHPGVMGSGIEDLKVTTNHVPQGSNWFSVMVYIKLKDKDGWHVEQFALINVHAGTVTNITSLFQSSQPLDVAVYNAECTP